MLSAQPAGDPPPDLGTNPEEAAPAEDGIVIEFRDTDLEIVVQWVSQVTGKRFLYDANSFRGRKVNLLSPEKFPADDVFKVFQSVLEFSNFALVTVGDPASAVVKIVKTTIWPVDRFAPIFPTPHNAISIT